MRTSNSSSTCSTLNVLYGFDDNYAPYAGISITSLLENNKKLFSIDIYIAAQDICEQNKERLCQVVQSYGRRIFFLDASAAFQEMQYFNCQSWNGSLATWLRFFVLDQIPASVEKILWVDSDTIVCSDLSDLCAYDINGYPIACVCDSICYRERYRLGFGESEAYYNAGVILFNLYYWRQNGTLNKMFRHLDEYAHLYTLNDQDLLNDFFKGKIARLSPQYNLQGTHLAYSLKDYFSIYKWLPTAYYSCAELEYAIKNPCIVHFFRFLGNYPWQENNLHPAKSLFNDWKKRSLWNDTPTVPPERGWVFKLEKILYSFLPHRFFLRIFFEITNRDLPPNPKIEGVQA